MHIVEDIKHGCVCTVIDWLLYRVYMKQGREKRYSGHCMRVQIKH